MAESTDVMDIELLMDQAAAWEKIAKKLSEIDPNWLKNDYTAIDAALAKIDSLARNRESEMRDVLVRLVLSNESLFFDPCDCGCPNQRSAKSFNAAAIWNVASQAANEVDAKCLLGKDEVEPPKKNREPKGETVRKKVDLKQLLYTVMKESIGHKDLIGYRGSLVNNIVTVLENAGIELEEANPPKFPLDPASHDRINRKIEVATNCYDEGKAFVYSDGDLYLSGLFSMKDLKKIVDIMEGRR